MKNGDVKLYRPLDILYAKVPLKTSDVFVRRLYVKETDVRNAEKVYIL